MGNLKLWRFREHIDQFLRFPWYYFLCEKASTILVDPFLMIH